MAPKKTSKKSAPKKVSTKKTPAKKSVTRKSKPAIGKGLLNVEKKIEKEVQKDVKFFVKNIEGFEHSIHFDIIRGLFAAVAFMIISQFVRFVGKFVTEVYYLNVNMTNVLSRFVVSSTGDPLAFTAYTMIGALFVGFLYAFFYHMVRVSIHGHAPHKIWIKGLLFGIFLVFVVSVPMALNQFLMLNLPLLLIIAWFAESIFINLIGGMAIAVIIK